MLSIDTQNTLCDFFRSLADLELNVESYRQKLSALYDFEPYAAFCRLDVDGDKQLYTMDFYNFMRENDRNQFSIKDCQLLVQFYDLDAGGSLGYNEFMKFILPCDDKQLRSDACTRKTYEVDIKHGKRLYPEVEKLMADYFEREINCHIKMEMLKRNLHKQKDWNTRACFNLLDSQRQGYVNFFSLYGFLSHNGFDATDGELIAIIRRIEGGGNQQVDFGEFAQAIEPIFVKMHDVMHVEDQGKHLARNNGINAENARPFLKKMQNSQPLLMNNSVDMNLQLYDQYQSLQQRQEPSGMFQTPAREGMQAGVIPTTGDQTYMGRKCAAGAYQIQLGNTATSPLRQTTAQQNVYGGQPPNQNLSAEFVLKNQNTTGGQASVESAGPYPRGPPMTDTTNIHAGNFGGAPKQNVGPLSADDERDMVQLLFEMISNEKELEEAKCSLVQQGDFNLMDAFQMIDEKNLGWVSAPQILTFMMECGVFAHKDDVYNFTRRFDRDNDSKLLYSDFCEAFTPKDSYHAHNLGTRKPKYLHNPDMPKKNYFSDQSRDSFFQCFKTHFHIDQKIEIAKKRCTRKPSFDIHDAFACVDSFRQGHLTRDDLKRLMQKNGFHPTESELAWLTARFDRNLKGTISYQEFMDEILPRKSLLGEIFTMNILRKMD